MIPILIEKAEKGQPYIWLHYTDGTKHLDIGTITKFAKTYNLVRINRYKAIDLKLVRKSTLNYVQLISGEKIKIPRRKLKIIELELKKTAI